MGGWGHGEGDRQVVECLAGVGGAPTHKHSPVPLPCQVVDRVLMNATRQEHNYTLRMGGSGECLDVVCEPPLLSAGQVPHIYASYLGARGAGQQAGWRFDTYIVYSGRPNCTTPIVPALNRPVDITHTVTTTTLPFDPVTALLTPSCPVSQALSW